MTVTLEEIQRLQFSNIREAQKSLKAFVEAVFGLALEAVILRPQAVSLNSFNGFLHLADGSELFFKSHVEPGGVIAEYYNSALLVEAGYPVIRPVQASTTPGKQMLLYEVVEDRSVFDVAWEIEQRSTQAENMLPILTAAQHNTDAALWHIYQQTLDWQKAEAHAQAPIHQLFHHRLTQGRLENFYSPGQVFDLPGPSSLTAEELWHKHWIINGIPFASTLEAIVQQAVSLLEPTQPGPAVIGHGDAHNGNVFLHTPQDGDASLIYFDPAFAGRHDPLLDLTKPFYHNVFAMWMYFPQQLATSYGAAVRMQGDTLVVSYNSDLSPVRQMFWGSKTQRVLIPLLRLLKAQGGLRPDWRYYLQSALACCPLLTMDLTDVQRFPPTIALLGLAHTVEMGGHTPDGHSSRIERWLDEVETAL